MSAMKVAQPIEACIIDLDGTLGDTLGDFEAALNQMSAALARAPVTRAQVAVMVALPPGAQILVGDKTIPAGFQFCDGTGCTAVALLDAPGLKALQAAPKARVAWFAYGAAAATTVELEIDGLTEALGLLASH